MDRGPQEDAGNASQACCRCEALRHKRLWVESSGDVHQFCRYHQQWSRVWMQYR